LKSTIPEVPRELQATAADIAVLAAGTLFLPSERHRLVAEAAYFRYLKRGDETGDPLQDWLEAEAELNTRSPQA
jgi:hypothetical protein